MKTWQADRMCVEIYVCTFVGLWEDCCVVLLICCIEPIEVFFEYERFLFWEGRHVQELKVQKRAPVHLAKWAGDPNKKYETRYGQITNFSCLSLKTNDLP